MEEKKKRGSNYTAEERDIVLELVKKYYTIIENKETNAHMISKKREAWESVCQQYNAVAVSGPRTWHQLRHLYENLKQRSKRNIAKENRLQFLAKIKEVQRKAAMEKKEHNSTDSEPDERPLAEQENPILAMITPVIQPLANPYDNSFYYGNREHYINASQKNGDAQVKTIITNTENATVDDKTNINQLSVNSSNSCSVSSDCINDLREPIVVIEEPETIKDVGLNLKRRKPQVLNFKLNGKVKHNTIYQQYLMTKLKNAKLETKYLINRNKMELNKYKLEVQILKLQINKLKSVKQHIVNQR
ncbi:uncharacterized protein LOC113495477 isoform X1 [Trichoplusia ni]|uniref:Regulatory protein zeste n=1 Tax=Trichoplusia ni TaxID=7111 RepID=A0A7E5VP46_TRINI|nr:uncharacterized protein LOC113495477 isoform X1 [Trichoplusia ni]XP_026730053.1 uncharacterized protein LOC113495477 isoform X1 [Trichoplusia ni]XP_026730054.1 uncharacterized protein LOC113495477 isoform X1 [Trichoplusia ni]XP_026730056.1 uncharacterized protein LOC113495477 isoform X1 [Trichoplusia ni]XP_026730057.1 uncharacterized protein LOC113495477 isoform X1 [Trichoplusia ni]